MRIRSIKPEFWKSDDIASLPLATRLLFIGLWSYVDDNGVGRGSERLIMAELFPLEVNPHDTLMQVAGGLTRLHADGLITRYTVAGREFVHVTSWAKHQKINRPSPPRYPLPTCGDAEIHDRLTEDVVSLQRSPLPGAVEHRSRGAGDKDFSSAKPPREDVELLCKRLHDRVTANGSKAKIDSGWRTSARLMLDTDGRELDKALRLIDWCQDDPFWSTNVLSMPKFRAQYDQLRLKANASAVGRPSTADASVRQTLALMNPNEPMPDGVAFPDQGGIEA